MSDPEPDVDWGCTYRATVTVTPIPYLGSEADCGTWLDGMINREVYVIDGEGKPRVIGMIQRTEYVISRY